MDKWLKIIQKKFKKQVQNYRTSTKGPKRSITDIKIYGKNAEGENLDYIKELVETYFIETRSDSFDRGLKLVFYFITLIIHY